MHVCVCACMCVLGNSGWLSIRISSGMWDGNGIGIGLEWDVVTRLYDVSCIGLRREDGPRLPDSQFSFSPRPPPSS